MLHEIGSKDKKKWIIKEDSVLSTKEEKERISRVLGVDEVLSQLLINRGYRTPEDAGAFLRMEKEILQNPFMLQDINSALDRIRKAINSGEKIAIFGDYDVDGVTSVCTLYLYLKKHGANVMYYIPNRIGEGYGVSVQSIDMLKEQGVSLVITVDNGITANEEIEYAKSVGIEFVVTDHHECQSDLPHACAVVNPHRPDCLYPFKELAGVGVVFKLICAYEEKYSGKSRIDSITSICDEYADLIAIGTIADVMPIKGENKLVVSYGLTKIKNTDRVGLAALMDVSTRTGDGVTVSSKKVKKTPKISSTYIGYMIAPRINAAGRMRSASLAVELFLCEDTGRAYKLAEELCEANRERQDQENRITAEAYKMIPEDYDPEKNPVIVLDSNDWHHGVIGIVSSRITERFGLPSILVSFDGKMGDEEQPTDVGKGSGRSVKGLNLVDALLNCSDTLVKFGGHELAAGLSVERDKLPAFREKINAYAREVLAGNKYEPTLEADMVLTPDEINMSVAEEITKLEPFGTDNPMPVFVLREAEILEISPVGAGKHTKMTLKTENSVYNAMFFSHSPSDLDFFIGDLIDVMFTLEINEWNGRKSVQLNVRDIHEAVSQTMTMKEARDRFNAIWAGGSYDAIENVLPDRNDFATVFNLVRQSIRSGCPQITHEQILRRLKQTPNCNIGYVKLKLIIRIFQELNLLGISEEENEVYYFQLKYSDSKTDLEKSNLLRRLRMQQKNG